MCYLRWIFFERALKKGNGLLLNRKWYIKWNEYGFYLRDQYMENKKFYTKNLKGI